MSNMMGSTYLDGTTDNVVPMDQGVGGDVSWMNDIGQTMSYPGMDAGPYIAESPTTLSPETPIDQTLFPSPTGDFSYLDTSFGDFTPNAFAVADVPAAQMPLRMGRQAPVVMPDRFSFTSAPNPSLYAPGGVWPTHASPSPFLPTPPMADDLSDGSTPEDDYENDEQDEDQEPPKRRRSAGASKSKKRSQAQLRTASRAPKKRPNTLPQRPSETVEDVKAREAHNQVEQQYRKRLNAHFERLLAVLPAPGSSVGGRRDGIGEKRVSKAEVLDLATERIRMLEKQMARLEKERRDLRGRLSGCI